MSGELTGAAGLRDHKRGRVKAAVSRLRLPPPAQPGPVGRSRAPAQRAGEGLVRALAPRSRGRCQPRSCFPRQIFKSKAEGPAPPRGPLANRRPEEDVLIGWEPSPWKP